MPLGVFCTATLRQTQVIVHQLRDAEYSEDHISLLLADTPATRTSTLDRFATAPHRSACASPVRVAPAEHLSWLCGAGTLKIPGPLPLIASGSLVSILSANSTGAEFQKVREVLIGVGIPESETEKYQRQLSLGSALISVHCHVPADVRDVLQIFATHGATYIATCGHEPAWTAGGERGALQ